MHYHVDVFAGAARAYIRGLTLLPVEDDRWVVFDEVGLLAEPPRNWSEPLPLPEAMKAALALLYPRLEQPLFPAWGSAPFELLGYTRPGARAVVDHLLGRDGEEPSVGADGLPSSHDA